MKENKTESKSNWKEYSKGIDKEVCTLYAVQTPYDYSEKWKPSVTITPTVPLTQEQEIRNKIAELQAELDKLEAIENMRKLKEMLDSGRIKFLLGGTNTYSNLDDAYEAFKNLKD